MPLIECTLIEGYDAPTRRLVCERITDAACSAIGASPEFVIVTVKEVAPENYMRGRNQKKPAAAPRQPEQIVRAFLAAMEKRALDEAVGWLADDVKLIFPGGVSFSHPGQVVAWAKTRYQSVSKTIESMETAFEGESASVFCFGTLQGTWLNGESFAGIRFIDRFAIRGGKITEQQVWNDLAENKHQH